MNEANQLQSFSPFMIGILHKISPHVVGQHALCVDSNLYQFDIEIIAQIQGEGILTTVSIVY